MKQKYEIAFNWTELHGDTIEVVAESMDDAIVKVQKKIQALGDMGYEFTYTFLDIQERGVIFDECSIIHYPE